MTYLAETDLDLALAPLQAAACTYRIALGPRAGQKVLSLQTVPSQEVPPTEQRCVSAQGFEGACRGVLRRPSEEETRTPVPVYHPPRLLQPPRIGFLHHRIIHYRIAPHHLKQHAQRQV